MSDEAPAAPEPTPEELEKLRLERAKRARKMEKQRARQRELDGTAPSYMERARARKAMLKSVAEKAAETDRKRRAKVEQMRRCIELYAQGIPKARIAVELGKSPNTIGFWLKDIPKPEPQDKPDPIQQALELETSEAVNDETLMARDAEEQALTDNAKAQSTPADQYQAYVAAQGIRMLRDNFKAIRGPRTVRELSELDQLIRRNLGLNPRGGSGNGGGLQIDISILNNTKATPRTGVAFAVDAEEVES